MTSQSAALQLPPASPGDGESTDVISTTLATLRKHLNMDVAFVGRFRGDRRSFEFVDAGSPSCPVRQGAADPLEVTYCARVVSGQIPQLIVDAGALAEVADLRATKELPVGAHMSVPLRRAGGEVLGTLCCFSHEPDLTLRERDLRVLHLFAAVVGPHLESLVDREDAVTERRERIGELLASGGPRIALQPIIAVATGELRGFEALSRFPEATDWGPARWFAEAEAAGLGARLEQAALTAALALLPQIAESRYLSVNVSAPTLCRRGTLDLLSGAASRLVVELTEHVETDNHRELAGCLAELRRAGVAVAVDDAGSGWSGLERILRLEPDVLKLDRALVHEIADHPGRQAMVEAMVGFARRTGAALVAEGVEEPEDLRVLTDLGVEYVQGYLLGRPSFDYVSATV